MSNATEEREVLHQLIDSLRPEDVPTAHRVLEALHTSGDPLLTALRNAPFDDERETAEEHDAVGESNRELDEGEGVPHEEAMRRFRVK